MKHRIMTLIAVIGGLTLGAAELPLTPEDLTFEYKPTASIATAEFGGAVKGTYQEGNLSYQEIDGKPALRFVNPGKGFLAFPTTGNLPAAEGTILLTVKPDIDVPAVLSQVKSEKRWSQMYMLLVASGAGKGVNLYLDVINTAKGDQLTMGAMISAGDSKWKYVYYQFPAADLNGATVGFTWKDKEFALIVNGVIYAKTTIETVPVWSDMFRIGNTGNNNFSGDIYNVKIYQKAVL